MKHSSCSPTRSGFFFVLLMTALVGMTEMLFAQVYPSRTRSSDIDWRVLRSESFMLYYPAEARSAAIQTAYILDDQYPRLYDRFGGEMEKFPIVLNTRNSLSNGYVATFPYRSEIEVRPIKGKTLNPASGSWLETVVPHELVHAVHYQMKPSFTLTNGIGIFSPDLRRSVHGMVPVGLHEGIAVDHETHGVFQDAAFLYGRGSYPYFTNRFEAALSEQPWSSGQLFHISSETLPYDRHYIGGYEFMSWLRETYGEGVVTNSILHHYRKPFLGYGLALKNQTGKWVSELYREFNQDKRLLLNERLRATSSPEKERWNEQVRTLVPGVSSTRDQQVSRGLNASFIQKGTRFKKNASLDGVQFNRPLWITNSSLVVHGRFYNAPSGFYEVVLPDTQLAINPTLIHEAVSVSDYQISFSTDSSHILFSQLTPSLHYEEEWASVPTSFSVPHSSSRVDSRVTSGVSSEASSAGSVKASASSRSFRSLIPSMFRVHHAPPSLFGVTQNKSFSAALLDSLETPVIVFADSVVLQGLEKDSWSAFTLLENAHPFIFPVQLQAKPGDSDQVAVIANVRGLQGLWITSIGNVYTHIQKTPPLISFLNGSVLDVSWHPFEEKVLISSDVGHVIQLYEFNLLTNTLSQISFSDFNAFEPSYSPDGRSVAFIQQAHPEQMLGIVSLDSILQKSIPESLWVYEKNGAEKVVNRPFLGMSSTTNQNGSLENHSSWSELFIQDPGSFSIPNGWVEESAKTGFTWIKPRLWSPVSNKISTNERDAGVFFASTDLLREHSYAAEITLFKEQVWWDVAYKYSGVWPGFQVNSKKVPSFQTFQFTTGPADDPETTTFTERLLLRERGVEFSVPFEWNLSPGLHRSSYLTFQPSLESTQALFYEGDGSASLSDKVRLTRIGLFTSYRHNLRQHSRQIYPEKGSLFYLQTEKNFKSDPFELRVQQNTYRTTFSEKAGFRLGGAVYFPLFSKRNQSGRFLMELVRQTDNPVFSLESLTRNLLTKNPLPGSNGGLFSEARLVFPLKTIDDGYLTVPFYLNSIYLQTIHQMYIPYRNKLSDGFSGSHSVVGSGIALRSRFRLSNITIDAGIGLFWDSQSKKGQIQVGAF